MPKYFRKFCIGMQPSTNEKRLRPHFTCCWMSWMMFSRSRRRTFCGAGEIVQNPVLLSARDSVHIAVMERPGIRSILSFDGDFDRWPGMKRIYRI